MQPCSRAETAPAQKGDTSCKHRQGLPWASGTSPPGPERAFIPWTRCRATPWAPTWTVEVFCNAQDATGDTMNGGEIIVHGSSGDATGYAMRGGSIYIERDAGYRCGIHMKEYQQKVPAIVIGGRCGSFLGEYQAGGTIVVLGIGWEDRCPVGNFCGTGMHGGRIYLRTTHLPPDLPAQVVVSQATEEDISHLRPLVEEYCRRFQVEKEPLLASHYYVLRPNTKNPYKQLYVNN